MPAAEKRGRRWVVLEELCRGALNDALAGGLAELEVATALPYEVGKLALEKGIAGHLEASAAPRPAPNRRGGRGGAAPHPRPRLARRVHKVEEDLGADKLLQKRLGEGRLGVNKAVGALHLQVPTVGL